MAKTAINRKKAAKEFADFWKNKGDEKQHTQLFWTSLLRNVFGIEKPETVIDFEKRVRINGTKYIDAYIPSTNAAVEQKSLKTDLDKKELQSDGTLLTPYEQAKRYNDNLRYSERCRWIVVSNFAEFRIYDMEKEEPEKHFGTVLLENLSNNFERLRFLVDSEKDLIPPETQVSLKAGELVGKLYDALIKEYINPDENSFRSLNVLCVRIVFCLYAEDAGLFETRTSFEDYIKSFNLPDLRLGIINLFKALDTKPENRDKYDLKLKAFPYVNGGLFAAEDIEVPNFSDEIVNIIVNHCAPFDWSQISPTIFGAVFESTLNPETRRKGGMHYTSIENIHKVIDPLFLDDLRAEFDEICCASTTLSNRQHRSLSKVEVSGISAKQRSRLEQLRNKIASLKFLDPACGSGNFLTETYISLRRLENEILKEIHGNQQLLGSDFSPIKVKISQFYGIEINDFAVTVAKTALWIAESQMMKETEEIVEENLDFLPLSTSATIVEGNALRMDWSTLEEESNEKFVYADKLNVYKAGEKAREYCVHEPEIPYGAHFHELNVATKEITEKKFPEKNSKKSVIYDYIIGNPPFVGARFLEKHQKEDVIYTFGKDWSGAGDLDYVCCWYKKAGDFIQGKQTHCAFVSTNSITQGATVAHLWKPLFADGMHFDFAWRTFRWSNETSDKKNMAAVHCVIIGFSCRNAGCLPAKNRHSEHSKESQRYFAGAQDEKKWIFNADGTVIEAKNINGYLLDMPDVFIENRKKPLCAVSEMNKGSQPTDGGNLIISAEEYDDFIKAEPDAKKFIREFLGAEEFINGTKRYCLWLVNASPAELRKMPLVMKRIEAVKKMRSSSKKEATRNWAAYPYLFTENRQPESGNYLLVPSTSSENRRYIPLGFIDSDVISSNANLLIPDATLYEFGIMTSIVHNAWMRIVAGRLKSDYRYSALLVYNNFPWPDALSELGLLARKKTGHASRVRSDIEQTAQAILDARAKYPDSSLADLYDGTTMPPELRKAHKENDKAVMQLYGFDPKMNEAEIVAELFKMYEKLTKKK